MKITIVLFFSFLLHSFTYANTGMIAERDYLLHTNANIVRLRNHIKNKADIRAAWEKVLQKAEGMLLTEKPNATDCQELGLAYRMTGDSRFAEAIKKILISYIKRDSWEGQELLKRTPPWRGGLGTSHTSFYIAIGYDCAYNHLKPSERKQIAEGIVRLGIQPAIADWLHPSTSFHTFDSMGHNWWSACVYMAGFASLAVINEIPDARKWTEDISATVNEWINYSGSVLENKPPNFDREGGFYESINYASYGFSQYLLFRLAFQNRLPEVKLPEVPMMEKMADFFIQTTYYTSDGPLSVNFGDGNIKRNGNACVVLLWNLGLRKDRYAWYLNQVNNGDDREALEKGSPNGLVLLPELPELQPGFLPDLPKSFLFPDMGWTVMRNSWKDNATMLTMKSGFTWNHAHADAGSFILFHNGKYLIIDSGNSSYSNPLYTQYYCQSEAHNVTLFNGKAQNPTDPYFGVVNSGKMYNLIGREDYKYVMADATGPTSRYFARNYRSFLWIGDVILIIDDLLAYEPGKFEWLLHYNGQSFRKGEDLFIKDEAAEVVVRPLFPETFPAGGLPHDFPEQMGLEEKQGYKDHEPHTRQPYWSVSHFQQTDRTKFITAIILKNDANKEKLPVLERFEEKDVLGVRIKQNGKITEVCFNLMADGRIKHRNSINTFNGWETDAYLIALTFKEGADNRRPENIEGIFIGHGSYFRLNGQPLVHALSKCYMYGDFSGNMIDVDYQGQKETRLMFYSAKDPGSILLNGQKEKVNYDGKNKTGEVIAK